MHEDTVTGGVAGEIAARINDLAFEWLDAPVQRIGSLDTPIPFSPPLESAHRPDAAKIEQAARNLAAY